MRDALGAVQSVLVLGAGSDIAQAVARRLAARRATTFVLAGRRPDDYDPLADELRTAGATDVEQVEFDAADPESHAAFVDKVWAAHGDVDLALVAFGVLPNQEQLDDDPAAAAAVITSNYTGAVSASLAVAGRMRRQGHGTLVVLSSVAGQRARRSMPVYGSAKAGLDTFAQALSDRLHGTGVRVLIVRPGFVRTKMTRGVKEAPFAVEADAVADAVVRGLQLDAAVVWVPSFLRWVFVVFRHLPGALWRRMPF
jgi:decaprenylphospho-beta-D-erythro-pentofuranosid-2-ulose 2-reductase